MTKLKLDYQKFRQKRYIDNFFALLMFDIFLVQLKFAFRIQPIDYFKTLTVIVLFQFFKC